MAHQLLKQRTMIGALFNDPTYLGTIKMLDATVMRHEAIASNLANLETPNYKRIDVAPSFAAELQQAISAGNGAQITEMRPTLTVDTSASAANRDGNTVQLETELLNLNRNTMDHALETKLISDTYDGLRYAITGRMSK